MIEVSPRLVFIAAFVSLIGLYVWKDKKLERHAILFIRRTEKGIEEIDRIAKRFPRFWNYYGWAGVATGIISIFAAAAMIGYTIFDMVLNQSAQSGPSLIAPGLTSSAEFQPGVSFIPAEYWVASILVLMTVHELSHGIVARAEDIEIRSVGWVILGILPLGAFVEPEGEKMLPSDDEEKEAQKATWDVGSWKSRLKVLCAGSFANYITAAFFFLLVTGVTAGISHQESTGYMGVQIGENESGVIYYAQEGYPAYESGLRNGTLNSINGVEINTAKDLLSVSENIRPNQTINLSSSEGEFSFETVEEEVRRINDSLEEYSGALDWFTSLLMTVSLLNLLIGLFNMVPIKPLDGGLVLETFTTEFLGEEYVGTVNKFSLGIWAILLTGIILGLGTTLGL
jgi:hypothetical protein